MMMTETEFREHKEMRADLAVLLENPALKLALAIVEEKAKPRATPQARPNAHLDSLTAHYFQELRGIQKAVDTLRQLQLPNPIVKQDDAQEEPFFDGLPPEMKEAILKQRNQQA